MEPYWYEIRNNCLPFQPNPSPIKGRGPSAQKRKLLKAKRKKKARN